MYYVYVDVNTVAKYFIEEAKELVIMARRNVRLNVGQAFREDCKKLIMDFEKGGTVRYEAFCELWTNMQFPLVFKGRKSYNELQEFCEDTLVVAKQYLVLPGSLGERIGGLYLLYGLYYKIPCHGCKIKVTKSDWEQILQFKSEIKPHHDACYILAKLMHDRAFLHTIFDTELGLEKTYGTKTENMTNPYSSLPLVHQLAVPGGLFDQINILAKDYHASKTPDSSKLFDPTIGVRLMDTVREFEASKKLGRLLPKSVTLIEPTAPPSRFASTEASTSGEATSSKTTKNIKRKKMKSTATTVRWRIGHGFDTDSSCDVDDDDEIESDNSCDSLPCLTSE